VRQKSAALRKGYGMATAYSAAWGDMTASVGRSNVAFWLAWNDLADRYRRSVLGPLWMVMSLGVIVAAIGFLYTRILNVEASTYIPFLACSVFVWNYFQTTCSESTQAFLAASGPIKNNPQPYFMHIVRVVLRNSFVMIHTIPVVIVALAAFGKLGQVDLLGLVIGFPLLLANMMWLATVLAMLGARFRDVYYIVSYILQFLMFASPVFWSPELLRSHGEWAAINPVYHWIAIVREPLRGGGIPMDSILFSAITLAIGSIVAFIGFATFRRRIPYWV
jgi:ABC-type polysaccharide/polyol phosphate export permease